MGLKLYEIAEEYRAVDAELDANGGELTPLLDARLAAIGDALEDKLDAIGCLYREAQAEANVMREQSERFAGKARAAEARASKLKGWLLLNLKAMGLQKARGRLFSARVARASRPTISWTGAGEIPPMFRRERVELDAGAALAAYESGLLPGGFRVERTEYLDIR